MSRTFHPVRAESPNIPNIDENCDEHYDRNLKNFFLKGETDTPYRTSESVRQKQNFLADVNIAVGSIILGAAADYLVAHQERDWRITTLGMIVKRRCEYDIGADKVVKRIWVVNMYLHWAQKSG